MTLASRGQRVVPGHGGESGEQPAHGRHVRVDIALEAAADGILQERIEMDGGAQLVTRFFLAESETLVPTRTGSPPGSSFQSIFWPARRAF